MAATLTLERFTAPGWIFERKLDGIRLLAYKRYGEVRLYSRTRNTQTLPAIASAVSALPGGDIILDGELTWGSGGVVYHLFDVMWLEGRQTMSLPLRERRAILD